MSDIDLADGMVRLQPPSAGRDNVDEEEENEGVVIAVAVNVDNAHPEPARDNVASSDEEEDSSDDEDVADDEEVEDDDANPEPLDDIYNENQHLARYERDRLRRIQRNQARLNRLGLGRPEPPPQPPQPPQQQQPLDPQQPRDPPRRNALRQVRRANNEAVNNDEPERRRRRVVDRRRVPPAPIAVGPPPPPPPIAAPAGGRLLVNIPPLLPQVRAAWNRIFDIEDIKVARNGDRLGWINGFIEGTSVRRVAVTNLILKYQYFFSSGVRNALIRDARNFTPDEINEWDPFLTPAVNLHRLCTEGGINGHLIPGRPGDNRFGVTVMSEDSWEVINARLPRVHHILQQTLIHYLFIDRPAGQPGHRNDYPKYLYCDYHPIQGDNAIFDTDDEGEEDDEGQQEEGQDSLLRFDLDEEANARLARQIRSRHSYTFTPFCIVIQIMREYYRHNPTRGIPPNAPPEFNPENEWNHDPINEWDGQSDFYVNY